MPPTLLHATYSEQAVYTNSTPFPDFLGSEPSASHFPSPPLPRDLDPGVNRCEGRSILHRTQRQIVERGELRNGAPVNKAERCKTKGRDE